MSTWSHCPRCGRRTVRYARGPSRQYKTRVREVIVEVAPGARVVGDDILDEDFAVFCPRGHYSWGNPMGRRVL